MVATSPPARASWRRSCRPPRDGLRRGTDEGEARDLGHRFGESLALGEEAVAGMDRLGAGGMRGFENRVGVQIGLRRRARADAHRLVGHLDMQGVAVGVGIDRDGGDAHAPRGLDDSAGDFAPIRNQNLLEHASTGPVRADLRVAFRRSAGSGKPMRALAIIRLPFPPFRAAWASPCSASISRTALFVSLGMAVVGLGMALVFGRDVAILAATGALCASVVDQPGPLAVKARMFALAVAGATAAHRPDDPGGRARPG